MRTHGNAQKHETANPLQRRLIDAFHAQVVAMVRRAAPAAILEVGCGEGYVLAELQRAGVDAALTGVDLSPEAIGAARQRVAPPARLEVGDARALRRSGATEPADLVMMLEVLEHLDDPAAMLDDLVGLTTDWVLLSVPREPLFRGLNLARLKNVRRLGNDPEHVNHWGARSFGSFVARRFDVVATARPLPWTLVLARRRPAAGAG